MTAGHKKAVVIDPENSIEKELKNPEHFVFRIDVAVKDRERDAFLVLKASTLNRFAGSLIEESLAMGNLRIVFVRMDTNSDSFFDKVQELGNPELLSKLFKFTAVSQMNRILHAWCDHRADSAIASAFVDGDELVVQSCDLKHYRVNFNDFPGLAAVPPQQRLEFAIDDMGNHLFWPARDVSIDLDVVRYKVDEEFRKTKDMDALSDYHEFLGEAIQLVMSQHGLTQAALKDRGGPAERHLYRIAQGSQDLTSRMIERLARAHGLSSQIYVDQLVAACNEIVEQAAEAISESQVIPLARKQARKRHFKTN